MILWCASDEVTDRERQAFVEVMSECGRLDMLDERFIDAASAISGCGPAFVYMFAEALADGGVTCGLPRDKAMLYAAEMIRGAAGMILATGKHPGVLKDEVCSPGGSTIEGVRTLEEGAFRGVTADAVVSAYEKTKLLGK
jgi:pyrroline-5-carboxylate reductase